VNYPHPSFIVADKDCFLMGGACVFAAQIIAFAGDDSGAVMTTVLAVLAAN
jgi:hypothetical protein